MVLYVHILCRYMISFSCVVVCVRVLCYVYRVVAWPRPCDRKLSNQVLECVSSAWQVRVITMSPLTATLMPYVHNIILILGKIIKMVTCTHNELANILSQSTCFAFDFLHFLTRQSKSLAPRDPSWTSLFGWCPILPLLSAFDISDKDVPPSHDICFPLLSQTSLASRGGR